MYIVSKKLEVAGAHNLKTTYETPCNRVHGHNWNITVTLASKELDVNGMVIDFKHIKNAVHDKFDHQYLNDVLPGINPTAENIAKWICERPEFEGKCIRVDVEESANNIATYFNESHPLADKFRL